MAGKDRKWDGNEMGQWVNSLTDNMNQYTYLLHVVEEKHVEFVAVVSPGAEFEVALLNVEREVDNVDFTRGFEDGRRHPEHFAV